MPIFRVHYSHNGGASRQVQTTEANSAADAAQRVRNMFPRCHIDKVKLDRQAAPARPAEPRQASVRGDV